MVMTTILILGAGLYVYGMCVANREPADSLNERMRKRAYNGKNNNQTDTSTAKGKWHEDGR